MVILVKSNLYIIISNGNASNNYFLPEVKTKYLNTECFIS